MSIDLNKLAEKLAGKKIDMRVQSAKLPLRVYIMLRVGAEARERSIGQHVQGALVPWTEKWWENWEADIEAAAARQGVSAQELAERMLDELFKEKSRD